MRYRLPARILVSGSRASMRWHCATVSLTDPDLHHLAASRSGLMAGPNQNFSGCSDRTSLYRSHGIHQRSAGQCNCIDDLVGYMYDSLVWISSFNPAEGGSLRNGHVVAGSHHLHTDAGPYRLRYSPHAADIFSTGPELLHLTGEWSWTEVQPQSSGEYERLESRLAKRSSVHCVV